MFQLKEKDNVKNWKPGFHVQDLSAEFFQYAKDSRNVDQTVEYLCFAWGLHSLQDFYAHRGNHNGTHDMVEFDYDFENNNAKKDKKYREKYEEYYKQMNNKMPKDENSNDAGWNDLKFYKASTAEIKKYHYAGSSIGNEMVYNSL